MKRIVGIATYNEAENIERLVRRVLDLGLDLEVLIIDDSSPDGTGVIVDRLAEETGRVRVVHRPGKLGLGTATLAAVKYVVDNGYDVLVTMDADFSHDPKYLPAMLTKLDEGYDIVIGSRYVSGGGVVNWPLARRAMSFMVNFYCRMFFRLPAHDYSGAYRAYRSWVLARLDPARFVSKGYSFQEEMLVRCAKKGARIGEVPIVFVDRTEGATKANRAEMIRSSITLLRLGLWEF
jgi:dolichol-phosphate mannosyltransferase